MDVTTISNFRKNSKKYASAVRRNHTPLIITSGDSAPLVLISLEDYNSMSETDYLNASPANRRWLEESIAQLERGETIEKTMEELKSYESEGR